MRFNLLLRLFFFIALTGVFLGQHLVFAENVIVVVNKNVAESSLTANQVKKIILGKTKRWGNGHKIKVAVLIEGEVHKAFLKKYIKKSPPAFSRFMKKKAFSLKSIPAREFSDEKNLIKYIAKTKDSIGYVSSSAKTAKVKTVSIQ